MPFTQEQFFEVFQKYNTTVFPVQIIFFIAGLLSISLILTKSRIAGKVNSYFLVFMWLWTGIVYHIIFFSVINKAAIAFGALFILQSFFFLIEFVLKENLEFTYDNKLDMALGYILILTGLAAYPLIGVLLKNNYTHLISLGLPCPSVIYTFGVLVLSRKNYTLYKLIVPVTWSVIGFFAALRFGVYQDILLPVAAVITLILFFRERMFGIK